MNPGSDKDDGIEPSDTKDEDDASSMFTNNICSSNQSTKLMAFICSGGGGHRHVGNSGKLSLPMFGGTKDKITYHTRDCYVMGLKNNGHSDRAILLAFQHSLRGYAGEHYTTIAARSHDPAQRKHLGQS